MSEKQQAVEHLSEFMDGQSAKDASKFMVKRLTGDTELQKVWSRFHIIRDCIQQRGAIFDGSSLLQRVSQRLDEDLETGTATASNSAGWNWLKPAAGMAFTALVAVSAVLFVQNNDAPSEISPAATLTDNVADASFTAPNSPVGTSLQATPVTQSTLRLSPYLIRHNQVAGQRAGGVTSLMPIVSADDDSISTQPDNPVSEQDAREPVADTP